MLIGIDGNEANIAQRVGVNQIAFKLLHHFSRLETSHQFVVYLKQRPLPDLPQPSENFTYQVFGPQKAWVLTGLTWQLWTKRPRPDILFTPSHYTPLISPIPQALSIMDLSYEKFDAQYFKSQDLRQLRRWTRLSAQKSQLITTISQTSKKDIQDIYQVPADNIKVIYPGYNQDLYHRRIPLTKQKQVREKYGIKGKFLLFLGTLQPRKNISRLIEAFSILDTGKLVIVGKKGWMYQQIFQKVKNLKLEKDVIFTGFAPDQDIPALYRASQAFVLPSLYEGFGIPVIEAQACGALTVVSNLSSLPEIAGPASVYIDDPLSVPQIAESLRTAFSMPKKERVRRRQLAKKNVQRFSWPQAARQTLDALVKTAKT